MSSTINVEQPLPLLLRIFRKLSFPKKPGVLERVFGKILRRYGICRVACANGLMWKLNLADPCHRWTVFGKYEGGQGIDLTYKVLKNGGISLLSHSYIA